MTGTPDNPTDARGAVTTDVPKGPIVLALLFVAAAMVMPWVGTLPLHLAIAGKIMCLIYAAFLVVIAYGRVRQPGQSVQEAYASRPVFARDGLRGAKPARA